MNENKKDMKFENAEDLPQYYIAVFHGGGGEIVVATYVYKVDNSQANYGFYYVNVTSHTKSYGSSEWVTSITNQDTLSWIDDIFNVARQHYATSYVTVPDSDKTYTLDEFAVRFNLD